MAKMTLRALQDRKATNTGLKDGFLVLLFTVVGYIVTYLISLLPFLDTFQDGQYAWVKPIVALLLGAATKSLDRKLHEDGSKSTGLLKI